MADDLSQPALKDLPRVDGVEHRYVDANGVRIHVAEAGPAEGQPVLLLHGWPQHWYEWREVIAGLGDEFRLLAPDLRGFGWSSTPGRGYDPETFATDQIALLDTLGIDRAFVAGHDWGGFTSLLLGMRHPDRIERVLAMNTPHPWPRLHPRLLPEIWRSWYAVAMATPGLGRLAARSGVPKSILRRGNVHEPFTDADLDGFLAQFREPARARAATALYRWYMRAFARAARGGWRSERLEVPTLLLFGTRDRYVTTKLVDRGFERKAPQMQLELVPDSGHFIVDEKPDLVIARARELFAQPPRAQK
jgi:pimeloyl-ACP methyl ester carboxylesterase